VSLDLKELCELLAAINQTDISELTLKGADFELTVRRGVTVDERTYLFDSARVRAEETGGNVAPASPPLAVVSEGARFESSTGRASEFTSAVPAVPPPNSDRRLAEIVSPMVGTFYRSPSPDEPPFVDVGDRVRKGQTVCIIEAMKLMNELEAEVSGEIVEILAQNGEPVEYGQLLMRVNPD